jgi:hypothetical protein
MSVSTEAGRSVAMKAAHLAVLMAGKTVEMWGVGEWERL